LHKNDDVATIQNPARNIGYIRILSL
jgi:hypothetical protein